MADEELKTVVYALQILLLDKKICSLKEMKNAYNRAVAQYDQWGAAERDKIQTFVINALISDLNIPTCEHCNQINRDDLSNAASLYISNFIAGSPIKVALASVDIDYNNGTFKFELSSVKGNEDAEQD